MRKLIKRGKALGGVVLVLALGGAGAGLGFATPAHALEPSAAADDTTTTPAPEPSPDPAPAPAPAPVKPKPKPVSKPAPAPVHSSPAPVYHAPTHTTPTHTYTRTYTPTYTPPPVTHTTRAVTHHAKKHRRHVAAKPKPAPKPQVQSTTTTIPHVYIGSPTAAATTPTTGDSLRRVLVLAGIGFAALLFLIVLAVPATGARFTTPGRVVIDHQTDLLLAGVATLLLTALLFAVTGNG